MNFEGRLEHVRYLMAIHEADRKLRQAQGREEWMRTARAVLAKEYEEEFMRNVEVTKERVLRAMETAVCNGTTAVVGFESDFMQIYMSAWLMASGEFVMVPHHTDFSRQALFNIVPAQK
jgi:hypothetical protein